MHDCKITRTPRFRLQPTEQQRKGIDLNIDAARFTYNQMLFTYLEDNQRNPLPGYYELSKQLPGLKKEFPQLKGADSSALKAEAKHLGTAFRNYAYRKSSKPHRKRIEKYCQKYHSISDSIAIIHDSGSYYVKLPKLPPVRVRLSQPVNGRILSATVTREGTDRYYISFCIESDELPPALPATGRAVGLDMGLSTFMTTSDGEKIPIEDFYAKYSEKINRLNEKLTRQEKYSKRWQKTYSELNRIRRDVQNQRKDAIHKITTALVRKYDIICVEDLDIRDLMQKNGTYMKRAIINAAWGEVLSQLEYKSERYGKKLVKVSTYFPSSQLCHNCGYQWTGTKGERIRVWRCPICGTVHDRDVNAARNILREGLRLLSGGYAA